MDPKTPKDTWNIQHNIANVHVPVGAPDTLMDASIEVLRDNEILVSFQRPPQAIERIFVFTDLDGDDEDED